MADLTKTQKVAKELLDGDTANQKTPPKPSMKGMKSWANEVLAEALTYHAYSKTLVKSRATATIESSVRGIGQNIERLVTAINKSGTASGSTKPTSKFNK